MKGKIMETTLPKNIIAMLVMFYIMYLIFIFGNAYIVSQSVPKNIKWEFRETTPSPDEEGWEVFFEEKPSRTTSNDDPEPEFGSLPPRKIWRRELAE